MALMNLVNEWGTLGIDTPCPIHFTNMELLQYLDQHKQWCEMQAFWSAVKPIMSRNCGTTPRLYDEAIRALIRGRHYGLESFRVGEMSEEFQKQTR
ncbi:hypothetical protein BDW69DRAFT_109717 [Aspergillus filifer]